MRLGQRVHQEGGVVVDRRRVGVVGKLVKEQLALVDVVASGGVKIHFLEEGKVRHEAKHGGRAGVYVVGHFRPEIWPFSVEL